nr:hypothetical protein [Torque teno virus]
MAWRWWKRRRRWWLRKRWTRGRLRRRWPRPARRRPRRRRVRRRRRWRRGRPRRRLYRRYRRKKRRRRKPKIILKQWQPDIVKRCYIVGYIPAIICGAGTWSHNYTSHLLDIIPKGPFGGGHSTMRFSLKVLFEEHLRHLNFWTKSNQDLELIRYFRCSFKFYRDQDTDYIVHYSRKTPLGGNRLTAPSLHPGVQMLSKNKILVPSYATKPKGGSYVKVTIAPPTLLTDKWYFSKDICDTTLVNLDVVLCNLRFPFCSPQTDNPCITFQVLHSLYNDFLSIVDTENYKTTFVTTLTTKLGTTWGSRLNTFRTEGCYSHPKLPKKQLIAANDTTYFTSPDGLWGDAVFDISKPQVITENMESYANSAKQRGVNGDPAFCHLTGIYSPPWLTPGRISPETPGLYTDVTYNPYADKGVGNRIWVDYCSKKGNKYDNTSKCLLEDMPLWMVCFGYVDWVKKETGNWGIPLWARVLIRSPYAVPKLYNEADPNYGWVPISYYFGEGKMPNGDMYVPFKIRMKWYPSMWNQEPVLNDLAKSGPFAYKNTKTSVTVTAKYKFTFNFGGNPVPSQIVQDPCTQSTYDIPGTGNLPRRTQVIDPKFLGPHYSFHRWDFRRGLFGSQAIKRVSEQPTTSEFLFSGPKRPRIDQGPYIPPEKDSGSLQRESRPWSSSETEAETEAPSEEEPENQEEQVLQLQLRQQLREQRKLRQGIQCLFEQLITTQQGVHKNPLLE